MLLEGIIIKGYSGFYYVLADNVLYVCSLRGKYRVKTQNFLPGDRVKITPGEEGTGVIESVEPRKNELIRPPVANIDQVIIVMACSRPEPDYWLLDRLLITAQANFVEPVICFNKADLIGEIELQDIMDTYSHLDFPFIITSTKQRRGIEELREIMSNKISVFAGPSGVGKSSLFNAIEPDLQQKIGEISVKLARGKHTTRHVELIKLSKGGFLADTPGFSQTFLPKDFRREELGAYYPDFVRLQSGCRFKSCLHRQEPQCAVKDAVASGHLNLQRYERYLTMLSEVIEEESRF